MRSEGNRRAAVSDATVHLLIPRHPSRDNELTTALTAWRAAENVLQIRGVPQTDAGREAQSAMLSRANKAQSIAKDIIREAVAQARVFKAGGKLINGAPADAVKEAATNAPHAFIPCLPMVTILDGTKSATAQCAKTRMQ